MGTWPQAGRELGTAGPARPRSSWPLRGKFIHSWPPAILKVAGPARFGYLWVYI